MFFVSTIAERCCEAGVRNSVPQKLEILQTIPMVVDLRVRLNESTILVVV